MTEPLITDWQNHLWHTTLTLMVLKSNTVGLNKMRQSPICLFSHFSSFLILETLVGPPTWLPVLGFQRPWSFTVPCFRPSVKSAVCPEESLLTLWLLNSRMWHKGHKVHDEIDSFLQKNSIILSLSLRF